MFLVALPVCAVVALLVAIAAPIGIAAGIVLIGGLILVSGALDAVVQVALYRYAVDGEVLGAFSAADLDASFRQK